MPTGVYPRNKSLPNLFQKGFTPWNKGKPFPHPKSWYKAMKGSNPFVAVVMLGKEIV